MKKIFMFMMVIGIALCGCSSQKPSKSEELYKDLDAKQTIQKAVDYFNQNVNYYHYISETKSVEGSYYSENLDSEILKGKEYKYYIHKRFCEFLLENGMQQKVIEYKVFCDDNQFFDIFGYLSNDSAVDKLSKAVYDNKENYIGVYKEFSTLWSQYDDMTIEDIKREDKNGDIVVVLKYSRQLKYDDGSIQKKYYSLENYINSDGLLYKEVSNSYKDESYTKILRTLEATYSDFNKKSSLDYESAEKLGNSIDGKTFEEGKKLLEL